MSDWEDELAFLNLGFNTVPHSSTQAIPSVVFMGRHLSHPILNQWGLPDLHAPLSEAERLRVWNQVTSSLAEAREAVARRYNVGRKDPVFQVGDQVLCRSYAQPSKAGNISSKLLPLYDGPFILVKYLGPVTVLLQTPGRRFAHKKAHLSQLKPYISNPP